MLTFEEYLKKKEKDIDEDEMVAASPAPSGIVNGAGTTAGDVLGHCDHSDHGGFLGKDCFHIPKPVFKKPLRRFDVPGGKKRKKKLFYLVDAELDKNTIKSLRHVDHNVIADFIRRNFGFASDNEIFVETIFYYPVTKTFFLKFNVDGKLKDFYINFDFDSTTKKFKLINKNIMQLAQAQEEFRKILNMKDNSPSNVGSDDMMLWIVWGKF